MKSKKRTSEKQEKVLKKWRKTLQILMIIVVVVFVILAILFRQSVKQISEDPNLTSLTNESVFRIVRIMNLNENSDEPRKFEKGYYELKGTKDYKWLEGPLQKQEKRAELSEDFIRETLAGFMLTNKEYYQTIQITYPSQQIMRIFVKTENNDGDINTQLINLNAK